MNWNSPFEALSYMFKDNKFFSKYVVFLIASICLAFSGVFANVIEKFCNSEITTLILLVSMFPLIIIVQTAANIAVWGYSSACIKSLSEQKGNFVLPFFNFKKDMMLGLKMFAGLILLGILLITAFFVIAVICAIITGILEASMPTLGSVIGIILIAIVLIVLAVFTFLYFPAALKLFAIKQDPLAFFSIEEIIRSIDKNSDIYYKYVGANIVMGILILILVLLFEIPGIIITIFSPVIGVIVATLGYAIVAAYGAMINIFVVAKCTRQQAVVEQQVI